MNTESNGTENTTVETTAAASTETPATPAKPAKVGNWDSIRQIILRAKSGGVTVAEKKGWIRLASETKVRVYVQKPNASGVSRYVDVSGHGYDFTLAGDPIEGPAKPMTDNGNVAFRIDLTAPGGVALFDLVMELLPALELQTKPRATRAAGGKAGPSIDVSKDLGL